MLILIKILDFIKKENDKKKFSFYLIDYFTIFI